jgi:hypothetical protein
MDSSLGRLNQLSLRLRLLREQAIWQREATNTVTELLAVSVPPPLLRREVETPSSGGFS